MNLLIPITCVLLLVAVRLVYERVRRSVDYEKPLDLWAMHGRMLDVTINGRVYRAVGSVDAIKPVVSYGSGHCEQHVQVTVRVLQPYGEMS